MLLKESIKLMSIINTGDIILIYTKNNIMSSSIRFYEKSLDRNNFPIYANHIVQVYDNKLCLDQTFPKAKLSKLRSYFNGSHQVAVIRPNFTNKEIEECKKLMTKDIGTIYNVLQLLGFLFQWISYKIFKYKIENYLDIKKVSICSLSVLRRLKKISYRFDISKNEFHSDDGLVTPMDFIRACNTNNNFKFICGTGKFSEIILNGEYDNGQSQ